MYFLLSQIYTAIVEELFQDGKYLSVTYFTLSGYSTEVNLFW